MGLFKLMEEMVALALAVDGVHITMLSLAHLVP
jgi:hypothetical protein